ncbi:hypothetical protein LTR85_006495 [Meristemomyces frigidus]|nr:hypothetical protein LTR85_006495 [Meristemomyces frigidus]
MPPRINLPPLTRALLLTLLLLSALNAALRTRKWTASLPTTPSPATTGLAAKAANYLSSPSYAIPYLTLVPTTSIRYPWTFLTAALVENNVVSLAISGSVLWFGGRYLERAWGSMEFGKFVLFVTVIPNILSFCVYGVWHGVGSGTPEFPTPIQGLLALSAAFLVALKQLVPEHTVSLFRGAIRVRIKHFPALFTLANMISGPLLGTDTALWLSLLGFLTSWIYLRFFRVSDITSTATGGEGATMKGDASDTFAFVAFFPDALHPFLRPVCDGVYDILVQMRVCTPFSEGDVEAGNESAASRSEGLPSIMNGAGSGGGSRGVEAERRRAVALRALDQRLNNAAAARSAPVPSTGPAISGDTPDIAAGAVGGELAPQSKEAQA